MVGAFVVLNLLGSTTKTPVDVPHWPFIAQVGRRRRTVFSGHLEPGQPTDQGRRGDQGIRPTAPLLQALPWRAPQEAETCSIEVCVRPVRDSSPDFYPPSFSEHLERVGQAHQNSLSLISPSSKNVCQCSVRSRYSYGKINNWVRPLNLRNEFVVLLILSTFFRSVVGLIDGVFLNIIEKI